MSHRNRSELLELGEAERSLPDFRMIEEAQKAYEKAREHRRSMEYHQRARQREMQRFDLFKAELEAMGIEVIIEPAAHPVRIDPTTTRSHMPKGGNSDDRSSV